jgi:MFS transporter, MFS domain-containing protein family, molybdate-anion transporter
MALRGVSSTLAVAIPRGGDIFLLPVLQTKAKAVVSAVSKFTETPSGLFNLTLVALALTTILAKIVIAYSATSTDGANASEMSKKTKQKPAVIQSLQRRFLAVFWLLRCADWLQGPYFYSVYASKVIQGVPVSLALISRLFVTGFASTALFGPLVGRCSDEYGRKKATLAFAIIYAAGALTTKSSLLTILLLGRVLLGIGTSLLFSAPESWLVAEAQNSGADPDGKYLGETFGLAYAGDSIVAIMAGQLAGAAAGQRGPAGPFELSTCFLLLGGLLTATLWGENKANNNQTQQQRTTIREAVRVVLRDPKIMLVGAVQSMFEAAMYIFVLQWAPAMASAIQTAFAGSAGSTATPYGPIFSCFMACCLMGSTLFGQLEKLSVPTETFSLAMLAVATAAMSVATWTVRQNSFAQLPFLTAAFFAFEACVGMYFPSIGKLRSRFVPDSHRSVIMNLFGIPLNVLVVSVYLSIKRLGVSGALTVSSTALGIATLCMLGLRTMVGREKKSNRAGGDFQI